MNNPKRLILQTAVEGGQHHFDDADQFVAFVAEGFGLHLEDAAGVGDGVDVARGGRIPTSPHGEIRGGHDFASWVRTYQSTMSS